MAGLIPDEGETVLLTQLLKRISTDRDADLELGLFNTANPVEGITEATISEPSGFGYARKTLTDALWTVTGDDGSFAQQTFTPSGGDWTDVRGYFLATQGSTPRIVFIELDATGPHTIFDGNNYNIDLDIDIAEP